MKKVLLLSVLLVLVGCGKKSSEDCEKVLASPFGGKMCVKPTLESKVKDALDEYLAENDFSCSVEDMPDGAMITCPDGSAQFIADGSNGSDGEDGSNGLDGFIVAYIDPCGEETVHDELIYVDRDGNFHAWFRNVGHTILHEGVRYVTTDGTACKFEIVNGAIVEI